MESKKGVLTFEAWEEDLAHLLWLIQEEVKRGLEDEQDVRYWEGLVKRLKVSGVFTES